MSFLPVSAMFLSFAVGTSQADEPDPQSVLTGVSKLTDQGRYDEALRDLVWFHENALRIDPAMSGVRHSFALTAWIKLGEKFPKARDELVATRDRALAAFDAKGGGSINLFSDVAAIDGYLDQNPKTIELFKALDAQNSKLAPICYNYAEGVLAAAGEYALCGKYLTDPEWRLTTAKQARKIGNDISRSGPRAADLAKMNDQLFVRQACLLIQILVGSGRKPEAQTIRTQALTVVDSPEIRESIGAAELKIPKS